jgi:threonylcarbamoyladenosine tRNA methylthiotransferase MtaB
VVMGCAAGIPGRNENIAALATLPGVISIIPGADLAAIAVALGLDPLSARAPGIQTGARALLRIQDGCDEHCTFCATTIARGASRSRTIESVVEEAALLADTHPEIVVTGIHMGTYGRDIDCSLGMLMEALISQVPRVRFRLTSIEATEVDDRLAELFSDDATRLAPHLHAPLQSGSNPVLKRMGRHWYTAESYENAVMRLTTRGKPFALSADVIAGFPGETDADHQATMSLIDRLPFTALHVFPYSARPGTAAERLKGAVPGAVARARAGELRALAAAKALSYEDARAGGTCDVVITERGKGLTEDYLSVTVADFSIPRRARFNGRLELAEKGLAAFPDANENA